MNSGMLDCGYVNNSPRIAAWAAHYRAKGCSDWKAQTLAHRKVQKRVTWP